METVKVDIQKLQLLNDRIAQTIDALNQVRMTTHGLSHTGADLGVTGQQPFVGGAQFGSVSPFGTPQLGNQQIGAQPYFAAGMAQPGVPVPFGQAGISHTSMAPSYARDPFWAARAAQAFPYAQYPYPPVGVPQGIAGLQGVGGLPGSMFSGMIS